MTPTGTWSYPTAIRFGAGRIAEIGKGLGSGIKSFKKGLIDDDEPEKLTSGPDKT